MLEGRVGKEEPAGPDGAIKLAGPTGGITLVGPTGRPGRGIVGSGSGAPRTCWFGGGGRLTSGTTLLMLRAATSGRWVGGRGS